MSETLSRSSRPVIDTSQCAITGDMQICRKEVLNFVYIFAYYVHKLF